MTGNVCSVGQRYVTINLSVKELLTLQDFTIQSLSRSGRAKWTAWQDS